MRTAPAWRRTDLLPIELDGERRDAFCDDADVVADALELDIRVAAIVFDTLCEPLNLAAHVDADSGHLGPQLSTLRGHLGTQLGSLRSHLGAQRHALRGYLAA